MAEWQSIDNPKNWQYFGTFKTAKGVEAILPYHFKTFDEAQKDMREIALKNTVSGETDYAIWPDMSLEMDEIRRLGLPIWHGKVSKDKKTGDVKCSDLTKSRNG